MVYIVNDGRKIITSRSGDNNFTSTSVDMSLCFCFGCIESGALQNYVYTKLAPRTIVSIRESVDLDLFTINSDGILASCYGICFFIFTLRRVIF